MTELRALFRQFLSSASPPSDLFTTTDWDTLVAMWLTVSLDASRRLVVEWRMSAMLVEVTDLDILISRRVRAPSSSIQALIERRMAKILPNVLPHIAVWDPLVKIKRNVHSGSVAEHLVARRMREILPGILPSINDWTILVKMWKVTPNGSRAEQLVEARMIEMIFAVSADAVPEWFEQYLRSPESIPSQHISIHFYEKVQMLLAEH